MVATAVVVGLVVGLILEPLAILWLLRRGEVVDRSELRAHYERLLAMQKSANGIEAGEAHRMVSEMQAGEVAQPNLPAAKQVVGFELKGSGEQIDMLTEFDEKLVDGYGDEDDEKHA